jgi:hypothetical protein
MSVVKVSYHVDANPCILCSGSSKNNGCAIFVNWLVLLCHTLVCIKASSVVFCQTVALFSCPLLLVLLVILIMCCRLVVFCVAVMVVFLTV